MLLSVAAALVSAFALYAVSYQTRRNATANQDAAEKIQQLERAIAILRAERAYLMRPDRIEPLARKLGLRPPRGDQFVSPRQLKAKVRQP